MSVKVDKQLKDFVKESRRKTIGLSSICIECERKRR